MTLVLGTAARANSHEPPSSPPPQRSAGAAADTGPLLDGTKVVALGLGAIAILLGVLLYVGPVRDVAATKRAETAMSERVLTLQEEDRRRIARELHDGAGQALTAARLQLIALRNARLSNAEARAIVERIVQNVDEAIEEVRRSTSALAPPALAELGLVGALVRHCEQFASASDLDVRLDVAPTLPQMPAYLETTVYRIAQEALNNVARHADAHRAWIRLSADGGNVRLEIGDDGAGLGESAQPGFGLDSIRDRARLAGGTLEVVDARGPGARIRVAVPVALKAT